MTKISVAEQRSASAGRRRARCLARAKRRFLVWGIATSAVACDRRPTQGSSPASVATPAAPRFWLTPGSALTSATQGPLNGPTQRLLLVELLPTGRIRPVGSRDKAAEAELPQGSQATASGRGLALYVQQRTDLHYGAPDGPVFGRLHPGALVRVALAGEGAFSSKSVRVRVGSSGASLGIGDTPAFCDREVLSTNAVPLSPYRPEPGTEALRAPFDVSGPTASQEPVYNVSFSRCYDVFAQRDQRLLWQYIEGVETFGREENGNLPFFPIVADAVVPCTGRVVTRSGGALVLHRPEFEPQVVSEVPLGFELLESPAANVDPLSSRVREGRGELYWIVATEEKLFCSGWRFKKFRGPRETRDEVPLPKDVVEPVLTGKLELQGLMDGKTFSYPLEYVPPTPHQAAQLWLGSPRLGGNLYFKCSCENNYTILKTLKDELWVSGRVIPDDVLAFDPNEKERWFFSRSACEAALTGVRQELSRDPTSGTRLGIHARSNIVPH